MSAKKQHLQLMDTIICRTPAFSVKDELSTCWPTLKQLIKEASPEFHSVIADLSAEHLDAVNEKTAFTIWKYFNRARFRSTPFGNFAAISFAQAATGNTVASPLRIKSEMLSQRFADWSAKDDHLPNAKKITQNSEWFLSNATYYIVGDQLRYVRNTDGQFELATVMVFDELDKLLTACRTKQNKASLYNLMASAFEMQPRAVDNLLCQLVECQLLLTELMPNITGEDYFRRSKIPQKANTREYIIAERDINKGLADTSPLNNLAEYLEFIKNFTNETSNNYLDKFCKDFSRKFDLRSIPLSIALDPETGIGYGDMAQAPQEDVLGVVFSGMQKNEAGERPISYSPLYRFLLNELLKGQTIQLDAFNNNDVKQSQPLPNTLSVMYQYWQGMPVLQSAGGCTANALLGRFTLGCQKAEAATKHIVAVEENANPDVLFFDIAYQAEKRVDNVNRRKQIYKYELPILTWSCNKQALSMDDILIMVRNNEIILWSKQYNKRFVPRVATAYNYNRSDLAAYRFLCDLQHQHIKSDLTFNLRQHFPGLDKYPRVIYKNIIVSPAMWRIDQKSFLSNNSGKNIIQLKNWLKSNAITGHFKCGNTDQTLCFDPENEQNLFTFLTYCKQNTANELYIQEALMDETSMISDENGKQYIPQYIANYFHEKPVYRRLYSYTHVADSQQIIDGTFSPGSEWLYFEIYCHPLRANDVLEQYIAPIVNTYKKQLQNWFFIRYSDPKPHIRLRLQLKNQAVISEIICNVKSVLQPLCASGLVADIQLKTYRQEIERYGAQRMGEVESFFYYDSKYVLRLLSQGYSNNQLYHLTLKVMNRLFTTAFEDMDERISIVKTVADSFSNEFSISSDGFKAINKSFENFRNDKTHYAIPANEAFLKQYFNAFKNLTEACNAYEKASMVADLVHMHVNRVFFNDQRMHEAILYQYLQKLVKVQKHLSVAEPVH